MCDVECHVACVMLSERNDERRRKRTRQEIKLCFFSLRSDLSTLSSQPRDGPNEEGEKSNQNSTAVQKGPKSKQPKHKPTRSKRRTKRLQTKSKAKITASLRPLSVHDVHYQHIGKEIVTSAHAHQGSYI